MSNGQARSEQDRPKTLIVVVALIVSVVTLLVIGVGVKEYYEFSIRDEITKQELAPVDPRRLALEKLEHQHLTEYQWVNQKNGIVRIPIDRAMKLTIRDWNTLPAHVTPAMAPTTPPVPAPPGRSREMPKNGGTK